MKNFDPGKIVFILLIISICSLLIFKYYKNPGFDFTKFTKSKAANLSANTTQASKVISGQLDMRISFTNKDLTKVFVNYNFYGTVKDIRQEGNGVTLIINAKDPSTPSFIVDNLNTQVFTVQNNVVTPAKVTDLQKGQQVAISTTYEVGTKDTITRSVHIIQNQ